MKQSFKELLPNLHTTALVLHPTSTFELYFEQEFQKAFLDQVITKAEARQLGRNLGKKIFSLMYSMIDTLVPNQLITLAAKLIAENISDKSIQASCWGNLRKGFVGDCNSFISGQRRASLVDSAESQMKEYQQMFFRYPQLQSEIEKSNFDAIKSVVAKIYPLEESNVAHEASLLLYNMSILRKGLEQYAHNKSTSYLKVVENLLYVCRDYKEEDSSKSLVDILSTLSRISAIYDKAAYRIIAGRKAQDEFRNIKFISSTKHDFLRRIRNTQQLKALLTRGVQSAAASLVARGSYLGRLYLDTLIEFPWHAPNLHQDSKQNLEILKAKYTEYVKKYPQGDGRALKEFIGTKYLKIGFRCLNQQPGEDNYFQDASDDVAILSEFVFSTVFQIEFDKLVSITGEPSSKVAFIVGGANSRREYPSFDYDWYCVYQHDGQFSKANQMGITTYNEFFTLLAKNISAKLLLLGGSSDVGFAPHDPITHKTHWASTLDSYTLLLSQSADSHLELRLRQSGMVIAGDVEFGSFWLKEINKLIQEKSEFIIKARARSIKSLSTKKPAIGRLNIKTDKGGLRQGTMLWLMCSTIFDQNFSTMEELVSFLKNNQLCSDLESKQFINSYKFLLTLRVRLDMHYGRNDKNLPIGSELVAFAKSVGYPFISKEVHPSDLLMEDLKRNMSNTSNICTLILDRIRDRLLEERCYDIYDDSHIRKLEEETEKKRADYLHIQRMKQEESGWLDDMLHL